MWRIMNILREKDSSLVGVNGAGKIVDRRIGKKVEEYFLNYAKAVLTNRALPDVRDGMKPVHRRIVYAMTNLRLSAGAAHKKSARVVGEIMGKYHPHGDLSIYNALVRMAQSFSMRYPVVDGQGNFGSLDGDAPAAMRYTEARLSRLTNVLVENLHPGCVTLVDNYDEKEKEPTFLPTYLPLILLNGSTGIAVGMATNIPPHNLREVMSALVALIKAPNLHSEEIQEKYITGPDFPTGANILGVSDILNAYRTGRGSITIRSSAHIVADKKGKKSIIISEIPYQLDKSRLMVKISKLAGGSNRMLEGIVDIRDESNEDKVRIVIDLKRGASEKVILYRLFKYTPLQQHFSINTVAVVNGRPRLLNIKELLLSHIKMCMLIAKKHALHKLNEELEKRERVEGLIKATANIEDAIEIVKNSSGPRAAMIKLRKRFNLSAKQAKFVLAMKLGQLTRLEVGALKKEVKRQEVEISRWNHLLSDKKEREHFLVEKFEALAKKYGDKRRTSILPEEEKEIKTEELIEKEDVIVELTAGNQIRRLTKEQFRQQKRGGVGRRSIKLKITEKVLQVVFANSHDNLILFTNLGRVYRIKAYQIPQYISRQSYGVPVVDILPSLQEDEKVVRIIPVADTEFKLARSEEKVVFFVTRNGQVICRPLSSLEKVYRSGKKFIKLGNKGKKVIWRIVEKKREIIGTKDVREDRLVDVIITSGKNEIVIGTNRGKLVKFKEEEIRVHDRPVKGVRGIEVGKDEVIGLCSNAEGRSIIMLTTRKGKGKLLKFSAISRRKNRGGKGSKGIRLIKGDQVSSLVNFGSKRDSEIVMVTAYGMLIRIKASDVRVFKGKYAIGTKMIQMERNDYVSSITCMNVSNKF